MSEEKKKPNWIGIGLLICAVIFLLSTIMMDREAKNGVELLRDQVERMDQKADSMYRRQAYYEQIIVNLRKELSGQMMEVRVVEKERPMIYNNYIEQVSKYKNDSSIDPYYTRAATEFDSLLYSGFFFKK
jgi:hypothetical protein